jgi:Asp-tRNA(Asn)/Glu-tRNA(Gln) amidotransferase A subunit family amidase
MKAQIAYDPNTSRLLEFRATTPAFVEGADNPRSYLERCLETISQRESAVKAFVCLNVDSARKAADDAAARYRAGRPLSPVDGMPFGVKDVFETIDMPTQMNSPIYRGWQSRRDAAHVYALRRGGAVILGKTTTTEFAVVGPPPTRNPFDVSRTAGASSAGSCAAVGAAMLPVASGNQGRGSIVRPAGYCGVYGFKPTQGALNSGGGHAFMPSHTVLGLVGASLRDVWETAHWIAATVGGDRGYPGLFGSSALAAPAKPEQIVKLQTAGWSVTDAQSQAAFERFATALRREVPVLTRADDARIEELEQALARVPQIMFSILGWEMRWPGLSYRDLGENLLNPEIVEYLRPYEDMTLEQYRTALAQRDELRALFERFRAVSAVCIAPVQIGPPPQAPDTGDPVYGDVTSLLGSPAVVMPLLAVDRLPFGVQIMGQPHEDERLFGWARWIGEWALARPELFAAAGREF